MITELLPLTKNKLKILTYIYEKKETYLLDISKNLRIHPFSSQKTVRLLKSVLLEKKLGRTILLSLDKKLSEYFELAHIIEDYKLKTRHKDLKLLIKNLQEFFSKDNNILTCITFGSLVRGVVDKESDIDLMFVTKTKDKEILRKCSQLSTLLNREINPIILTEKEFKTALSVKEPTIMTILKPSQRLLVIGKEYFLRKTFGI